MRISIRYPGPGRNPEAHEDRVPISHAANTALIALRGRRTGDRVRLTLSPDIAQAPTYGTNRHRESWKTHVGGTTGLFDVAIGSRQPDPLRAVLPRLTVA